MKLKHTLQKTLNFLRKLPLKYVYIGGAVFVLLGAGAGTVLFQQTSDKKPVESQPQKTETSKLPSSSSTPQTDTPTNSSEQPTSQTPTSPTTPTAPVTPSKKPSASLPVVTKPQDVQKPTTPTNLVIYTDHGTKGRILDWDASSDETGVVGYYIYKKLESHDDIFRRGPFHNVNDGSTDDTDVNPMCSIVEVYTYYAVQAYDAAGNVSDLLEGKIRDEPMVNCYPIGI